jgi:hypothetical protein
MPVRLLSHRLHSRGHRSQAPRIDVLSVTCLVEPLCQAPERDIIAISAFGRVQLHRDPVYHSCACNERCAPALNACCRPQNIEDFGLEHSRQIGRPIHRAEVLKVVVATIHVQILCTIIEG